ncbi:putative pectinesterase [Trifolium repens]|nr:putative pectinesterase [Trifolium repens]
MASSRLGTNNDQAVALRTSRNKKCYIQGIVDFVFGNERSLYEGCTLQSIAENVGYVTAKSRPSLSMETEFSFTNSRVIGTGQLCFRFLFFLRVTLGARNILITLMYVLNGMHL